MAINRLAINGLHIIGEELGDIFISAPVQRHAQVVAILGFEFVFDFFAIEQVGTEPVQVGELLVRQLVKLFIGTGGETGADEVFQIQTWVGPLFARTCHVVGQVHDLAVAVVGTDQVRVGNPAVVNRLARLHRGLQFFNHVALLDQVVLDGDASDFGKGLGQGFGLVLMGGDGLRHHRNFFHALGLQFFCSLNEPLHLGHLLVFGQGRWLELVVHPFFRFCFACPSAVSQHQGCSGEGNRTVFQFHASLLKVSPCSEKTRVLGKLQTVL